MSKELSEECYSADSTKENYCRYSEQLVNSRTHNIDSYYSYQRYHYVFKNCFFRMPHLLSVRSSPF